MGSKYVAGRALDFATSFEESGPATPMFFILSPGVDPLKDVENQGEKSSSWCQGCPSPMHFHSLHLSVSLFQIQSSLCNTRYSLTVQKARPLLSQQQGSCPETGLLWALNLQGRIHSSRFIRRPCPTTHPCPLL